MKPDWCPQDVWEMVNNLPIQGDGFCDDSDLETIARALLEAEQRKKDEIDRLNAVIERMQQTMSSQAEQWSRSMSEAEQRGRRMGMEEGPAGLSKWDGWDQSRLPWSECHHKDDVLEALFRGPWSMQDAACLIGFIDRMWGAKLGEVQSSRLDASFDLYEPNIERPKGKSRLLKRARITAKDVK